MSNQSKIGEINLRQVARTFTRRWSWIACGSAVGLATSSIYLLATKPVYQGEFQIVLSQEKSQSGAAALLSTQNPALGALRSQRSGK